MSAAKLRVVVAGICYPHFRHVDGIVEVGPPAGTEDLIITGALLTRQDILLDRADRYFDPHLS